MTTPSFTAAHWHDIITCYDTLLKINDSPVIRMNRAFCLYKAGKKSEALDELRKISPAIQADNIYYSLMMGELLKKEEPENAAMWMKKALAETEQAFRKEYIQKLMGE